MFDFIDSASGGICKYCHDNCMKCTGEFNNNCSECKIDDDIMYIAALNMCTTECPPGFIKKDGACSSCIDCKECNSNIILFQKINLQKKKKIITQILNRFKYLNILYFM